jgi:putative addiction module killer protein
MKPFIAIREYLTSSGANPFRRWLSSLDTKIRARVQARIFKAESGNLGSYRSVGGGIFELKLDFGPGYRIYFSFTEKETLLLLIGGDKSSQKKDIRKAITYLESYLMGN